MPRPKPSPDEIAAFFKRWMTIHGRAWDSDRSLAKRLRKAGITVPHRCGGSDSNGSRRARFDRNRGMA